jgi:hypothetical protein
MRRILFVCVAVMASMLFTNHTQAQVKLGYFEEEKLLPFMPGVKKVDTLLALFQRDTLGVQYDTTYAAYKKFDSLYRRDSAILSPENRLVAETKLNRYKGQILYWSEYEKQRLTYKEAELMFPYKRTLSDTLMAVINENGYTLAVHTSQLSKYATPPLLDNLTIRVAMKLHIPLAKSVTDDWNKALAREAAKAKAPPAKAPVKGKK